MWSEVRAYPVFDKNNQIPYVIKIGFDITKKALQVEEHRKQLETLEGQLKNIAKRKCSFTLPWATERTMVSITRREYDVLRLMAEGLNNNEISKILAISPHTVKSHVIHIFNKLGVNDRTQAAVWATRLKLV
jgi:ATP/maltotriose-dependent transcriptional regulator MalT